jgi:REP element-mobilizing transposase RayT
MARPYRVQFPGAVYHVMSRGNRKAGIVEDDDDRRTFMKTFGEAAREYELRVYACCLMSTHYHALLETPRGNLSAFVRALNGQYSKSFNRRHERVGHTFQQRFRSIVVQREKYLRRVVRYIALNPVKAQLCGDAADWLWSTHRATTGLEEGAAWLHLDWLRWAFRADTLPEAQRRYREYVRDPPGLTWSFEATAVLGTVRFKQAIDESLRGCGPDRVLPLDCRRTSEPPLAQLLPKGQADTSRRDARILSAHAIHGYRVADIARYLAVVPSTVSKALKRARCVHESRSETPPDSITINV